MGITLELLAAPSGKNAHSSHAASAGSNQIPSPACHCWKWLATSGLSSAASPPPAISEAEYTPIATGTRCWNSRLIIAGTNAWISATPAPPSRAVASNAEPWPISQRARHASRIIIKPRAMPRRSPKRASTRTPTSATRPMHTTGRLVSRALLWKLRPVAWRISPSNGLIELRIGRR
ncbi:hypothetical protein FX985_00001 [Pseudomonas extremaustralis]|uniref:Uncharacterized protein n=1 Tax=Pseudomonas extremaustralis TaxID=359110 RepID=A0A5M9ITV0_9PSED|nr:hypothetical protein FX985_00001 [Pseudomonas extremaustralis]